MEIETVSRCLWLFFPIPNLIIYDTDLAFTRTLLSIS